MKALSLHNLRKTYRNGHEALCGIDLDVDEGDFFALLGPNGAGKSTAIGIISSLVNKSDGKVEVFGHDLDKDPAGVKSNIGLVPQEFNFNQFEPVVEIVVNQAGYYGIPRREGYIRAEASLRQLDLWQKRNVQARELSGGMKRRLMIARALVHRPRLLILDEPTAGVDIEIRRSMWDFLREINAGGTTIILTTHYLEEAESLCRNIAIINHGRIAERARMSEMLRRLHAEYYLLDVRDEITDLPSLPGFEICLVDSTTIEVCVTRDIGISRLFVVLAEHGIEVQGVRNKQNRLERLFIDMVQGSRAAAQEQSK
ncbi:MAG: ABC transporter ATP-binding protein [Gammaproteobacteria bacterium]|nr:ABC transporter ATP-binding protein [Gammaproteobacteria bacterium]